MLECVIIAFDFEKCLEKEHSLQSENIHESNIFESIQVYLQSHEVRLASYEALGGSKGNTMSEQSWAKQENLIHVVIHLVYM